MCNIRVSKSHSPKAQSKGSGASLPQFPWKIEVNQTFPETNSPPNKFLLFVVHFSWGENIFQAQRSYSSILRTVQTLQVVKLKKSDPQNWKQRCSIRPRSTRTRSKCLRKNGGPTGDVDLWASHLVRHDVMDIEAWSLPIRRDVLSRVTFSRQFDVVRRSRTWVQMRSVQNSLHLGAVIRTGHRDWVFLIGFQCLVNFTNILYVSKKKYSHGHGEATDSKAYNFSQVQGPHICSC